MSDAAERAARVRRGAGWFALADRGLVRVQGSDRVRWTNGMLSNDVADLAPGSGRSGCYALLLTPQGRIVTDVHVLSRPQELWLELGRAALPDALARLARYVIADDVTLSDLSEAWRRFALEGPRAPELLSRVAGHPVEIAPDGGVELRLAGATSIAGAWGCSGEAAYQLFVPPAAAAAVERAFAAAAEDMDLVEGDADTLEVLRIEAGAPWLGAELGLDVLPAEAGLVGRAVSFTKGCYTGQEIVARMDSRDAVGHRLVGFRFAADAAVPAARAAVLFGGKRVGELTSVCRSALAGTIGLGYVQRAHTTPDTEVAVGGASARIAALPFVARAA